MKFFSQSFLYDDPWPIVSLAFFLRYPNPYASHVLSCDVISRDFTPSGSLVTTRLILKTATLPRWAPRGIVSRSESWILEESEVDPQGKIVRCLTRNLDHVKAMQVHETQIFSQVGEGKTLQTTEARIVSGFGWGLTRQIENYGLARSGKMSNGCSREGVALILDMIRQARQQPMTVGSSYLSPISASRFATARRPSEHSGSEPDNLSS
ncbi:PRELI-like family-domain-containing protein [Lactifluus volemus]|nr:PRELI-like family-domain-containing protein [Lactifluus volemus]